MSSASHAAPTGPDRPTTAQIMEQLKAFDRHAASAADNFAPFMEELFGPDWHARNCLNLVGKSAWGGRWR
eukprot:3199271-Prorocentrum_lima.AAC.1